MTELSCENEIQRTADLNDEFRRSFREEDAFPSKRIVSLGTEVVKQIYDMLRTFDAFPAQEDPAYAHVSGSFEFDDNYVVFWRIESSEYYTDIVSDTPKRILLIGLEDRW